MDSGVVTCHVDDQQQVEQSEDEHNHGKKSVLTRVKAKAIKLKETIRKHGHDHNHDQNIPDDHELDEEDDQNEVEGIVQDPEVHGAPIYESAAVMSALGGQEPHQEAENAVVSSCADQTEAVKTFVGEEKIGERRADLDEGPHAPKDSRTEPNTPLNYQSKVNDATVAGTEEIYVASIQNYITRLNIEDELNTEPKVLPTADGNGAQSSFNEGHGLEGLPSADDDQFSLQQSATTETQYHYAGSHDQSSSPKPTVQENPAETMETYDATNTMPEEQPNDKSMMEPSDQGAQTEKISSTTSATDENPIRREEDKSENTANMPVLSGNTRSMIGSAAEYGKKIASSFTEKLAPAYGAPGAGSVVISNSPGSGSPKLEKGVSMKYYLAEKLRPGDEDKALSEVISEAFHNKKEKPTKASDDGDRDTTEVVSDTIYEPKEELKETENGLEESNVNSPGKGSVVGKLKGMVGSWFGKAAENQTLQGGEDLSNNSATEVGQSGQLAEGKTS